MSEPTKVELLRARVPALEASPAPRRISVVLPVYNERDNIGACLLALEGALAQEEHEILVCYDFDQDSTLEGIAAMERVPASVRLVRNRLGRGAANAIKAGFQVASGDVVVTTMADLCDPPAVIPRLAARIREDGAAVVSGSRYMKGGSQTGGPFLKQMLSRTAGLSLCWVGGMTTHDPTNNFRAYSRRFLDKVEIQSQTAFDIALELTVKAQLAGERIAEVPSSWTDRSAGQSNFRMWKWMPNYLRWYWASMTPAAFVWAIWLAMAGGAAAFVGAFASRARLADGLGEAAPGWPWSSPARAPLPDALRSALVGATGDARVPMFAAVAVLAALAALSILLVRRIRGRIAWSDAFLPLAWLHVGGATGLLSGSGLATALAVALAAACWMSVASGATVPRARTLAGAGACLVALPWCGADGLVLAPALALALGWIALSLARSEEPGLRRRGLGLALAVGAAAAVSALAFLGSEAPLAAQPAGVAARLGGAARFLSRSIGPFAAVVWPASAAFVLGVAALSLTRLWLVLRSRPYEHLRTAALLGAFGAVLTAAFAGGAPSDVAGALGSADVARSAPLLVACYFVWARYGSPASVRAAHFVMFTAVAIALVPNVDAGLRAGRERAERVEAFERDAAVLPIEELARRHWRSFDSELPRFEERLRRASAAGLLPSTGAAPPSNGTPAQPR